MWRVLLRKRPEMRPAVALNKWVPVLSVLLLTTPRQAPADAQIPLTQAAANSPTPSAELSRLNRGQELRRFLLASLSPTTGVATTQTGMPANLVLLASSKTPADFASSTVVVHERFDQNPTGVWVGYADGHLEFVRNEVELKACVSQPQILKDIIAARGTLAFDPPRQAAVATGQLQIRVLDPEGHPVEGAMLGCFGSLGDLYPDKPNAYFVIKHEPKGATTNAAGEVFVNAESVFIPDSPRFHDQTIAPLFVLTKTHALAALTEVNRSEFTAGKVREIRLQPACRVTGELTSLGLIGSGISPHLAGAVAFKAGMFRLQSLESVRTDSRYEFILPPGNYGISSGAYGGRKVLRYVRIEANQREMRLQIDLPPANESNGFGRPAPELGKLVGWKNGPPVRLVDLRGKVVLIDFWGYWCPSCVEDMPTLMAIHDEFKDRGLIVIAVHDNSVSSIEEMDAKLARPRKDYWRGRDLPFLVALDSDQSPHASDQAEASHGSTTAAFGVRSFPTTFVVGRDGTLLREIDLNNANARAEIKKILEMNPSLK